MRVVGDNMAQGPPGRGIHEPDAEQEVYLFASSLNKTSPEAPSRRTSRADVPERPIRRGQERRAYMRVRLALPLRVKRVAGQRAANTRALRTEDISSSGVFFLSPRKIEPGTPIELELLVVDRPLRPGSVRMRAEAHVIRTASATRAGWHGVAAAFDDIRFFRDEQAPSHLKAG